MAGGFDATLDGGPSYGSDIGDFYKQGEDNDLSKLMAMLKGGGIGDLLTGGALSAGSAMLGGIADLIRGPSWEEKNKKKVFSLAQNRMGQSVLDPDQYMADYMRASRERNQNTGNRINKQLGLDSGVAQGQLQYDMESPLASFMLNAKMKNDELTAQNDNMLMRLMASLTAGG